MGERHSGEGWTKSLQLGCSTVQGGGSVLGDKGLGSLEERTKPWVPPLPTEVWHKEWLSRPWICAKAKHRVWFSVVWFPVRILPLPLLLCTNTCLFLSLENTIKLSHKPRLLFLFLNYLTSASTFCNIRCWLSLHFLCCLCLIYSITNKKYLQKCSMQEMYIYTHKVYV